MDRTRTLTTPTKKQCRTCDIVKTVSDFHKCGTGYQSDCKKCRSVSMAVYSLKNRDSRRAYNVEWRKRNREHVAAKGAEWRRNNRERHRELSRIHTARRHAALVGAATVPFTPDQLNERWAYYGNKCWLCNDAATETDHVKPLAKGGAHMLCNLRPVCRSCNASKKDAWPYEKAA